MVTGQFSTRNQSSLGTKHPTKWRRNSADNKREIRRTPPPSPPPPYQGKPSRPLSLSNSSEMSPNNHLHQQHHIPHLRGFLSDSPRPTSSSKGSSSSSSSSSSLLTTSLFHYKSPYLFVKPWSRRKCLTRLARGFLLLILVMTISINVVFILETTRKFQASSSSLPQPQQQQEQESPSSQGKRGEETVLGTANGHAVLLDQSDGGKSAGDLKPTNRRSNQLRLQENTPKFLTIEVLSSQAKVSVTVDGTTVRTKRSDCFFEKCGKKRNCCDRLQIVRLSCISDFLVYFQVVQQSL